MTPGGQAMPGCSTGGKFRLTSLALGHKRIYHLRREWPRPARKRRHPRRPAGLTMRGVFR